MVRPLGLLFQFVVEFLAEVSDFGGYYAGAVGLLGMEVVVVEVVILGAVEVGEWNNFSNDGGIPDLGLVAIFDGFESQLFLLGITREDDRAVLWAVVRPLLVDCSGVANSEEDFQQIVIRDDFGVEDDVDCFGVPGSSRLDLLIAGVLESSARVAGFDASNALELFEDGFHAPEASGGECGGLLAGFGGFDWRRGVILGLGLSGWGQKRAGKQSSGSQCGDNIEGDVRLEGFHND